MKKMMNKFQSGFLWFLAGIQILSPLWQAVWFGYDSIGLFLWELAAGFAGAYLCRILAGLLKRVEILEKQNKNDT